MDKVFKVESAMLIFAMRYALGRQTFSPTIVVGNIKHNIADIDSSQIEIMIKDIEEHGKQFSYGMDCDKNLWLGFRDYLEKVLDKRRKVGNW